MFRILLFKVLFLYSFLANGSKPNIYYPSGAIEDCILEGWVLIEYSISEEGLATNPVILDSYPGKIFVESALLQLEHWRYNSEEADKPIPASRRNKFIYRLEEIPEHCNA